MHLLLVSLDIRGEMVSVILPDSIRDHGLLWIMWHACTMRVHVCPDNNYTLLTAFFLRLLIWFNPSWNTIIEYWWVQKDTSKLLWHVKYMYRTYYVNPCMFSLDSWSIHIEHTCTKRELDAFCVLYEQLYKDKDALFGGTCLTISSRKMIDGFQNCFLLIVDGSFPPISKGTHVYLPTPLISSQTVV